MEQKNKMCRNVRLWISCQHSLLLCVTFYYLCATILLDMWRYSSWPYYLEIPLKSYATCESRTSIKHYEFSNNASMAFSYSYQVQKLARRSCMCYIIWSRFTYYHDKYGTQFYVRCWQGFFHSRHLDSRKYFSTVLYNLLYVRYLPLVWIITK